MELLPKEIKVSSSSLHFIWFIFLSEKKVYFWKQQGFFSSQVYPVAKAFKKPHNFKVKGNKNKPERKLKGGNHIKNFYLETSQ